MPRRKKLSSHFSIEDIEEAKKGLNEDSDIPLDDPKESEPYKTKSERIKEGLEVEEEDEVQSE